MMGVLRKEQCWARLRMLVLCFALALGVAHMAPSSAYAKTGGGGNIDIKSTCEKYKGVINRFGSCIKEVVLKVAVKYFETMYQYFLTALNATLTLGIVIYGVMLAAGMVENVKRDSFVVLLKVAFVVFFAQNLEMIFFWLIDTMDGLIDIYFQFTTSFDEGQCSTVSNGWGPFSRLDCLMDLVIGLKTSAYEGSYSEKLAGDGVSRGLLNFIFKAGVSSTLGVVVSAIGFAMVYTLVMTVIKIVFMYLLAIIAMAFIVMLGPIFIPLVMFKVTKLYFDKWINLLVSFCLQPVIMFAYVALMIIAFDKAILSGSNSLMSAIAGPEANQSNFNLNKWMENKGVIARTNLGPGIETKADDNMKNQSKLKPAGEGSATRAGVRRDESGGKETSTKTYAQALPISSIDWKKLADARGKEEKELHKEVMLAAIFAGLVMYVFTSMLRHIPSIGTDLTGGVNETPNLWNVAGQNPLSQAVGNLGGSLQQTLQRMTAR